MSTKLDWALYHAARGFFVFRIKEDGKKPKYRQWQKEATRDEKQIRKLWSGKNADCNIGAFTSRFEDCSLIVLDVDRKDGRDGFETIRQLKSEGRRFGKTARSTTASGGMHIIYKAPIPVKQGANVLGTGLDVRSRGGYIVMGGSTVGDGVYDCDEEAVAEAPHWLFSELKMRTNAPAVIEVDETRIDEDRAHDRAERYLERAPIPDEGERNDTAFKVACQFKDFGLDEVACGEFMLEWNENLPEPLCDEELALVVTSCYKTSQNKRGAKAVETIFEEVEVPEEEEEAEILHPFEELNKSYALALSGGGHRILWETKDKDGEFKLEHLNEASFHKYLAYKTIDISTDKGTKQQSLTRLWINDRRARRYEGIVFAPGQDVGTRFYNLWRGFSVQPIRPEEAKEEWRKGFEAFMEHTLMNICRNNIEHFNYLMDFAAHMVQKPREKPGVLVVFKGRKGVGKNVWLETLFALIKQHALLVDNRRYLTSNFNSHFEGKLAAGFDEAFWAGEKSAEGTLKGMITGSEVWIERKGLEPYPIDNILRLFFLSNEHWVVPATADERRYFVLDVGEDRMKDASFFSPLVRRMRAGGDRIFLQYLMERDISDFDPYNAPETDALIEQKHASLEPFEQWWYNCILTGELLGAPTSGCDFTRISCSLFRRAFSSYARQHHVKNRLPDDNQTAIIMRSVAPSMTKKIETCEDDDTLTYVYQSEGLEALRKDWEKYIGAKIEWPNIINEGDLECLK